MQLKTYRPTSPSRRSRSVVKLAHLSKKEPEKSLTLRLKKHAGRGHGTISTRHQGGGNKRLYRVIDFKRYDKLGVTATVLALEYDPNRSAHLALLQYADGEKRYILAPQELNVGETLVCEPTAKVRVGNALPLSAIPIGVGIHNIELNPGQGGRLVRSAGQQAFVMAKEDRFVQVRLTSGEIRLIDANCYATIGQVSNVEHGQRVLGKAGASRWVGRRPSVRGVAMAAGDHPHGGGEGRTGTGRVPKTVYGKPAYGKPTRKPHKKSSRYIVKSRKGKK